MGSIAHARGYRPFPGERYAILSFVDVGAPAPPIRKHAGCAGRLIIRADDVTFEQEDGYTGLTRADAERIAKFCLGSCRDIDTLIVHCRMGMSRSPAAAEAIAQAFSISDIQYLNQDAIANRRVKAMISEALQFYLNKHT